MPNKDQIRHMLTLYSLQSYFGHDDSSLNPKNDLAREKNFEKYNSRDIAIMTQVQVMDWLSTCFVRAPIGDVVAATTGIIQKEKVVTFYIANNNGSQVSDEDNSCTSFFLKLITDLKTIDFSLEDNVRSGVKKILTHIVKFCWRRLHRKMTAIRDALAFDKFGTIVNSRFIILVNKLHKEKILKAEDFRHTKNEKETNDAYVRRGVTQMKAEFESLILKIQDMDKRHRLAYFPEKGSEATPYSEIDKLQHFEQAASHCYSVLYPLDSILIRSKPLFPVRGDDKEEEAKEKIILASFARKMHNRLSRILKYNAGAQLFLTRSLEAFKDRCKTTNASNISFQIVWVAKSVLAQGLPTSDDRERYTKESLGAWLDSFKDDVEKKGVSVNNDTFRLVKQKVINTLKPQEELKLNPSLHCELALMHYCDANAILPLYNVIGVSKLNCWSCRAYSDIYNMKVDSKNDKRQTYRYIMSGSSGKAHHNWYTPRHIGFELRSKNGPKYAADVIISGRNAQLMARTKLIEILSFKPTDSDQHSVGSDSSTASVTICLVEQLLL